MYNLLFNPMREVGTIAKSMMADDSIKPRIDIMNDDSNINVVAEMPGVAKEDISVSVNDENILTITGKKEKVTVSDEEGKFSPVVAERRFGNFARSILLPDNIDSEHISANYKNGILDIAISKKEPVKPKEVNISIN